MWGTEETSVRLGIVALIWGSWCVQHSLLNSEGPVGRMCLLRSKMRPYYRFLYNVTAVLTLVAASKITPRANEMPVAVWHGALISLPVAIWTLGIFVFWLTFRCLDWRGFLGLSDMGLVSKKKGGGRLITGGIYGVVRHPQFAAGLFMLWARNLRDTDVVINIVLSAYLLVGAHIEERRILGRFGEEYIRYRQSVPAFLPRRIPRLGELLRPNPLSQG